MSRKPVGRFFCTEDHIVPKSKGGTNSPDNLVGACHTCNNMRGTIQYEHFYAYIRRHGNRRSIRSVLKGLSREAYLSDQEMYDGVRAYNHDSHLPQWKRSKLKPMFGIKPLPTPPPYVPVPVEKPYRRDFLHITRRKLESIVIGISYRKRQEYLLEGQGNEGRYLGSRVG